MRFDDYQTSARSTAIYPQTMQIIYPAMGLCAEAGEVANKVKKIIRDGKTDREAIADELGDVLWYVAVLAYDLNYTLSEIAEKNVSKLIGRKERGTLAGNGDNR
jgi:NTP pyrophosphatase (non-canonical NTP hydrolase)